MRGTAERNTRRGAARRAGAAALLGWTLAAGAAQGGVLVTVTDGMVTPPVPLELTALTLQGTGVMPLGVGFANRDVQVTVAPSPGQTIMGNRQLFDPLAPPGTMQKELNSGDPVLFIDSFFDVFFDITIADAAPGGGAPIAMISGVKATLAGTSLFAVVDTDQPNLGVRPGGLFSTYQVDFTGALPFGLGTDLDGDGTEDTLALDNAGFQCGVTAVDAGGFPTITGGLQCDFRGSINPPFSVVLTGPTTYEETPVFVAAVPEPAAAALFGLALTGIVVMRRRSYSGSSSVSQ